MVATEGRRAKINLETDVAFEISSNCERKKWLKFRARVETFPLRLSRLQLLKLEDPIFLRKKILICFRQIASQTVINRYWKSLY